MKRYLLSLPKWLRIITIIAIIWGVLRLVMQIYVLLDPSSSEQVAVDLKETYLVAAGNFAAQKDLYANTINAMEGLYLYSPSFAMLFIPLTWLPEQAVILVYSCFCIAAYCFLFYRWQRIFSLLQLKRAGQFLSMALPLWIVFSPFWDDLTYLNIYTFMALIGTLLIESVLTENVLLSSIWLTIILAAKPQWAFAAAVPLLLGRYRFFFKSLAGAAIGYLILTSVATLTTSPAYILAQYRDYFDFLSRLGQEHPWRTLADGFLGYNHSIVQIGIFLGGKGAATFARIIKYLLLIPLVFVLGWHLLHPARRPASQAGQLALELSFLLYLGAFLWLDVLWEIYLAIIIFIFLISSTSSRAGRIIISGVFLPYALLDAWRVICYLAGSPMINDAYFAWDFSAYIPIIMIVLLTFYFILLRRLWLERKTLRTVIS